MPLLQAMKQESALVNHHLIAIDLIGHGNSSHRPAGAHYNLVDYVQDLYELVQANEWKEIYLVGHSLGGIVSAIFSACFPQLVKKFVSIEAAGPLSEEVSTTVEQLSESIKSRVKSQSTSVKQPESIERLVLSRMKVSDLDEQNAYVILTRNLVQEGDVLRWRTDHRLRTKSTLRLTESQAEQIVTHIACPTLLILATEGFTKVKANYKSREQLYSQCELIELTGGHHLHMESPGLVSQYICAFLTQL